MRLRSGVFASCCLLVQALGVGLFLRGFFPVRVRPPPPQKGALAGPPPEPPPAGKVYLEEEEEEEESSSSSGLLPAGRAAPRGLLWEKELCCCSTGVQQNRRVTSQPRLGLLWLNSQWKVKSPWQEGTLGFQRRYIL